MTENREVPELGQIVRVIKGREQGQYGVIIDVIDNYFVWIADGEKRKFDKPKKKNRNHLEYTPYISSDVRKSLLETNRVSNGKLRFSLNKFQNEFVTDIGKGDMSDV